MTPTLFKWREISDTPTGPGVYAWYCTPVISDFDINSTIEDLTPLIAANNVKAAKSLLNDFFEKFLFKYFTEDPYEVSLSGPLKPKYRGEISHIPSLSDSLLDRILEDPNRLKAIQSTLKTTVPSFASPIYIGMSETLRARLTKHKALIEKLYSKPHKPGSINKADQDQCFAWQVFSRGIDPSTLFVMTKDIQCDAKNYVDIENILNRIHFPVFGRN